MDASISNFDVLLYFYLTQCFIFLLSTLLILIVGAKRLNIIIKVLSIKDLY